MFFFVPLEDISITLKVVKYISVFSMLNYSVEGLNIIALKQQIYSVNKVIYKEPRNDAQRRSTQMCCMKKLVRVNKVAWLTYYQESNNNNKKDKKATNILYCLFSLLCKCKRFIQFRHTLCICVCLFVFGC